MEVHRDATVSADQKYHARLAELCDLASERRAAKRCDLVITQFAWLFERRFDVVDDRLWQTELPRRIVKLLGIVAHVLVVEQPLHSRRPE